MIKLKNVEMTYDDNGTKINALKLKKLEVKDGEKVAFIGSSGCGKTTLFNLISGMLTPTKGEVQVEDIDITTLNESERDLFRANHIGYIFQDFNLFPDFTVLQNVVLPMSFSKRYAKDEMEKEAVSMLKRVGLDNKKDQKVKPLKEEEKYTTNYLLKQLILYTIPFVVVSIAVSLYNTIDMLSIVKPLIEYGKFSTQNAEMILSIISTFFVLT